MCRAFIWGRGSSLFVYADDCPEDPGKIREALDTMYADLERVDREGLTDTEQLVFKSKRFLFVEIFPNGLKGLAVLFERAFKKCKFQVFRASPSPGIIGQTTFLEDQAHPDWVLTPAGWIRRKA